MEGDEKTGAAIVLKALEEPIRQIALNGGLEGSVIIDKILSSGKVGYGFDAYNEQYGDMIEFGIVDPTKVTRSALQNAASVAAMVLTTESLVADIKEETPAAPAMACRRHVLISIRIKGRNGKLGFVLFLCRDFLWDSL